MKQSTRRESPSGNEPTLWNDVSLLSNCANTHHRHGKRSKRAFRQGGSAGSCTFIAHEIFFFVRSHRQEFVCPDMRMHTFSNYRRFSVFSFPWDILTCQHSAPRYRTTEQFYLSKCSGKSIPFNIGKALCRPVSPTRVKSHFEKMVTHAINHSSASQRPITFSSLN